MLDFSHHRFLFSVSIALVSRDTKSCLSSLSHHWMNRRTNPSRSIFHFGDDKTYLGISRVTCLFIFTRNLRDVSFPATMPRLFVFGDDADTFCFRQRRRDLFHVFVSSDDADFYFRRKWRDFFHFPATMPRLLSFPATIPRLLFSVDFPSTMPRLLFSGNDAETFNFLRRCRDFFHFPATMPRPFNLGDDAETFLFRRWCRDFSFPATITIL